MLTVRSHFKNFILLFLIYFGFFLVIIAGLLIVCGVVIRAKAASHLSYNNKASKAVTDNSGPFAGTFFKVNIFIIC